MATPATIDIRDLDFAERAAFLEAILEAGGDTIARDLLNQIRQNQAEILNWAKGSSTETYPITMPDGTVINIPSPSKIAEDSVAESEAEDPGDLVAIFEANL
jgi:hypothetical protein